MGYTLATNIRSTKEERRNRKSKLWARIRKDMRRVLTEEQTNRMMTSLKLDMHELIEISRVEGYQCGVNDTKYKYNYE